MRRAIIPALPILLGLFCGYLAARQVQGSQTPPPKEAQPASKTGTPPASATGADGATDPASMAGDKQSNAKPVPIGGAPVEKTFIIGAEDVLQIWVLQQQGISGQYSVRPDGI